MLDAVPDRLRRQCRTATLVLVAGVAFGAFMAAGAGLGAFAEDRWRRAERGRARLRDPGEHGHRRAGPVWLLGEAQRDLARLLPWIRPAATRSAYGAFIVQGLVLIGLAATPLPLPLPAEAKALLVAFGGVVGSFALAWLFIHRVPGVGRVD